MYTLSFLIKLSALDCQHNVMLDEVVCTNAERLNYSKELMNPKTNTYATSTNLFYVGEWFSVPYFLCMLLELLF